MTVHYHELKTPDELDAVVDLQMAVWGMEPRGVVPNHMLHAIIHCDGVLIGAQLNGEMIGHVLGLPARREHGFILWSHMVAVHPDHQNQGIGWALKQAQRTWAMEHGYDIIAWTYDPLQRGNANFNLRRLGAHSRIYYPNFYGELADEINAGMPTDRMEITWDLHDERVCSIADGRKPAPPITSYPKEDFLLYTDHSGDFHQVAPLAPAKSWHLAEIPYDLTSLKQLDTNKAIAWQKALREVMETCFDHGYVAVDFVTEHNRCWYVLNKE